VAELVDAGMDVARLNLSHGTQAEHAEWARSVRETVPSIGLVVTVVVRYSSTEVGIATSSLADDAIDVLSTTVGKPTEGVELRIVDAENRPLPAGEVGTVVVRSPATMRGYWRNPEATAAAVRDGWLWTGDVGSLDEDGFLTLKDRSKDLLISGGSNIYPREVEELLQSHPDVIEVAVIGRADPDWGEEVVACIVARTSSAAHGVLERDLDALCLDRIARFKRPKAYVFVAELPKNNAGKVLKTALRERLPPR
jgi:long-chain acyl-CoA synthetase